MDMKKKSELRRTNWKIKKKNDDVRTTQFKSRTIHKNVDK